MREGLIITAIGKDRPGIVDCISGMIYQESCNLEDSRMAILGGSFALIVLVTGPDESLARLSEHLSSSSEELDLTILVRPTVLEKEVEEELSQALPYRITAVSMDHPGIVHKISTILAQKGVNVAALDTRITHAPTTGTPVFSLNIEVQVPAHLSVSEIRELLEAVADEENLDLEFHAIT